MEQLSDQDRQTLREQFVDAHAHAEESFDDSVRTLAAGGVGVTVSLATALHEFSGWTIGAVALFLISLASNLFSFETQRSDVDQRIRVLEGGGVDGIEGNRWTRVTRTLNLSAGVGLLAGGVVLAVFVGTST